MPDYIYTGETPVDYIAVSVPGASFSVKPGEVISLEVAIDLPDFEPVVTGSKSTPAPSAPAVVPDVSGADLDPSQTIPAPEEQ